MRLQLLLRLRLCFLLFLHHVGAAQTDRLQFGESLSPDQTRKSSSGVFALGFFNLSDPGPAVGTQSSRDRRWYLGIWYTNVATFTSVWVANRANPISAAALSSTLFNISQDGLSLQLLSNGSTVWSSKSSRKRASFALIQNDGNLVLRGQQNRSETVWQSFDEPGFMWLAGMRLGTGQHMCSWTAPWDPSPGRFCLQIDPSGGTNFIMLWNHSRSAIYWDSGPWDDRAGRFRNLPEMRLQSLYPYGYSDNGSSKYFYFNYPSYRLELRYTGQIWAYVLLDDGNWDAFWKVPTDPCSVFAVCGAFASCVPTNSTDDDYADPAARNPVNCYCLSGYRPRFPVAWAAADWSAGCLPTSAFRCSSDEFVELAGQSTSRGGVVTQSALDEKQCRSKCLSNCSCTAFAIAHNHTTSSSSSFCSHYFGDLLNVQRLQTTNQSLHLRLNPRDVPKYGNGSSSGRRRRIIAISVAAAAAVAIVASVLVVRKRRLKANKEKKEEEIVAETGGGSCLRVFSFKELRTATENFSESKHVGSGAFGSVFHGVLSNGRHVAVKHLNHDHYYYDRGHGRGDKQFRAEVATLGCVQHVNVVQLLGFCCGKGQRLLVYEYMPNGSLASLLAKSLPDWKTRFSVALGTARALAYLHDECRERIIHCDIKPENILLDSGFTAKVADFGLAKVVGRNLSRVLTTMRGTRGYLAPEWLSGLPITPKADVFSFGMTLLDLVCGRNNNNNNNNSHDFGHVYAVAEILRGNFMAAMDERLHADVTLIEDEVKKVAITAVWCIQDDDSTRPTMRKVAQILEGLVEVPAIPCAMPQSMSLLIEDGPSNDSVVFFWNKACALPSTSNATSPS